MSSPELFEWLSLVVKGTDSGDIKWRQLNPTSYAWEQSVPRAARVILQRVDRMEPFQSSAGRVEQRKIVQYILQVWDLAKQPAPLITLNGAEDPHTNSELEKLYGVVSNVSMREDLEFLRSLLPGGSGSGTSHTGG